MFHIRRLKPTAKDKAPNKVVAKDGTLMEQYYWFNALSFAVHFSERIEGSAKQAVVHILIFKGILDQIILYKL